MKLTSDSLEAHLAQKVLPAYLISGDEPLLAAEAADAVRARARALGFTERDVHFIERAADWEGVRASAGTLSLFGSRRVLEVRLSSARPGAAGGAVLVTLLERADPDTVLLILGPRLDRDAQSAKWVQAVEQHGAWVPVWPVEPGKFIPWLRARSRRLGLSLDAQALELLAARTEGNLLAAHQELEKLQLLGSGAGGAGALEALADSARFDVFRLSEAALAGDPGRSLRVLAGLRAEGTEPTLVLWALTKALRDLAGALKRPGGSGRGWQRPTAGLDAAVRRAGRLSLRALIVRAARADRMIKGRLRGDPWDEMALLAADLCARPAVSAPQSMFK
ncbi:MAG: DNA polymerase III subunit delta [Gammaproteobacteria bacterium]|nr:DNA polymerase III subunit delta [Gammaproteobacteria bacterium]